ncbi:MAG: outer membrane protein [Phenylobacterium sp.]|nr:outer membrane protein [Phenylobacterium sp.]
MRSYSVVAIVRPVALALALTGALGGCATVQGARARLVRTPSPCVDQTVQVYFEPESAELTRESHAVINAAAGAVRSCRVTAVEVLGLADAGGAAQANLELSRRRAAAVSAALTADGLPPAEFRVGAVGAVGAMTAEGRTAPLRRRVDVTLRLVPR